MADRMIFISWGAAVYGREERGLEVFNESVGLWGRMQQEGRIESFDLGLMPPNGGGIEGYVCIKGTVDQIAAVRESDDYLRSMTDASLIVQNLCVTEGYCGEGIARVMGMYQDATGRVPQMA